MKYSGPFAAALALLSGGAVAQGSSDAPWARLRFFFHLRNAGHFIRDEEGIELPHLNIGQILEALEELRIENPDLIEECSGWGLEVSDASGTVLFCVSVGSASMKQQRPWSL